jgi:hypothetical protein
MRSCFYLALVSLEFVSLLPAQGSFASGPTLAPVPIASPAYNFGMVGVTSGQVMRIVATNAASAPPAESPAPIPACGVRVTLFDSDGKVVGQAAQVNSLSPGKSFAVEQAGTTAGRQEYRAQVQVVVPPNTSASGTGDIGGTPYLSGVCNIISTLQVYDNVTGKTDFVLAGNPLVTAYIPPLPVGAATPTDTTVP